MSEQPEENLPMASWRHSGPLWVSVGVFIPYLTLLAWYLFKSPELASTWSAFLLLFLLFGFIALTSLGIGRVFARQFKLTFSRLEFNALALLLGLGLLSLSIMFVGMMGWLNKTGIFIFLAASGLLGSTEWNDIFRSVMSALRSIRPPRNRSLFEILFVILIAGLFPLLLVNVLTPVWDYDALVYHMEIPRQFLSEGRIYFDPEVMRSAHPFLGEMLFLVGMVFHVESLAKFVNLLYAMLFVTSTYAFALRFFNRDVALVAVGILVSTPILTVWATWAGIDFAWAAYELWAMYAVMVWLAEGKRDARKYMILAGVMSGLAASTKYLALPALLILALLILWISIRDAQNPLTEVFSNLLTFGVSAGLVMGVWYIKNWLWTGNPVYPFFFGGVGWDSLKDQIFSNDYMKTFGVERNLLNFLLMPYNVYAQQKQFSTLPLEIVHPLIWLAFLLPLFKGSKRYFGIVLYVFAYYIWWFFGLQQIRFLLPLYAFLAILAGNVIERFPLLLKKTLKLSLIISFMILNIVYQISVLRNSGVFSYIAGRTSPEVILAGFVDDYLAKQFIQQTLSQDQRVLFLWDSRGYYCDSRCIPDSNQSQAILLALDSPPPEALAQDLGASGITHILLHSTDAEWFIQHHDPNGYHRLSLRYFEEKFLPACGRSVFRDGDIELFEINCD
jgi:4-amino-4-deoxy-L-arabinose transferase-like glycosyltransferase